MNTLEGLNPRLSKLLRKKPLRIPSSGPPLPLEIPIDEELTPKYSSKHFYPAKPGEVLIDRYQTLVKVGWGMLSWHPYERATAGNLAEHAFLQPKATPASDL